MIVEMLELSGRPLTAAGDDARYFVDREEEAATVLRAVRARTNVLVLGERGSGKTSFLHHVERTLADEGTRPLYVDGSVTRDPTEFLRLLIYRIAPRQLSDLGWRLERLPASAVLLEYVRAFESTLDRANAPEVVLVDELVPAEAGHVLFGRLRDELWRLPVVWIVAASVADRLTYSRPPADAFFGKVLWLRPLDGRAAVRLLRSRLGRALSSDDLREIADAAEGNPRRLVGLAADAVVDGASPATLAEEARERERALTGLSDVERRIVADIDAAGPASASDRAFLERVGVSRSRAAQVLRELERSGVLRGTLEKAEGRRPRKLYEVA